MTDDPFVSLTRRQRQFIDEYLSCWNASEAARRVGYKNSKLAGHRLLTNDNFKKIIELRMRQTSMQADEVIKRLTQQASNEAAVYIRADGSVDLAQLIADGKSHLIKGIKRDRRGNLIVEFYDAQVALVQIGRAQRLFVDQVDMTNHLDQVSVNVYLPDNGRSGQVQQEGDETD